MFWLLLLILLLVLQLLGLILPHVAPGGFGRFLWLLGSDRLLWRALGLIFLLIVTIWAATHRPFWTTRRAVSFGVVALLMVMPLAYRAYPSTRPPSNVAFRVPFDGPVTVAWGGNTPQTNYHVIAPDQCWAYDLVVTRDGKTHSGDGSRLQDYFCYDMPLLAPADGVVIDIDEGHADMQPGEIGNITNPGGNQIILGVAEGEFLFLCHLKPGSILVKEGDRVTQGQPLARIGNSGHTSEPHLHMHLQDTIEPGWGEGIPMPLRHYKTADGKVIESGIPTGGFGEKITGQIIEHVGVPMTEQMITEVRQNLARLAGDFYETHDKIALNPNNVPEKFHHLIPYAELFGFIDDVERIDRVDDAPLTAVKTMYEAVLTVDDELEAWLLATGDSAQAQELPEEFFAFSALWWASMSAERRLHEASREG